MQYITYFGDVINNQGVHQASEIGEFSVDYA